MSKKYTKEELFKTPAIEIYKLVLEGKIIKKIPNGFWQQPETLENTKLCVKPLPTLLREESSFCK